MMMNNDKTNIILISVLFLLTILISMFISSTRSNFNYTPTYNSNYSDFPFSENITNSYNKEEDCFYCGNTDIYSMIEKKFEESGIGDFLSKNDNNKKPISLIDFPQSNLDDFEDYGNCTSLLEFKDSIRFNKNYKLSYTSENSFYISEKFKGTLSNFYIVETISKIYFSSNTFTSSTLNYYDGNGTCVYAEMSNDYSKGLVKVSCTNLYDVFLCKEFIDTLNFINEEKYNINNKNYDVLVYTNENSSIILKIGKEVPILFSIDIVEDDKYLNIELIGLEELK